MSAGVVTQNMGDVKIVYFTDARILDQSQIETIGTALVELVDKCEHSKLLLNFQDVRFMGSAMIGKIISLNKKCKASKVDLKLCSISKDLLQVFQLTRLDKVLDIHREEARAIAAFEKKGWFG